MNPKDGPAHLVLPVSEDSFMRLLVLLRRLLQLYAVDLNAMELRREIAVEHERIPVVHVSPPRFLVQDTHLLGFVGVCGGVLP